MNPAKDQTTTSRANSLIEKGEKVSQQQRQQILTIRAIVLSVVLSLFTLGAVYANPAAQVKIDNFGQIDANYYRGGQPQGQDYADLAKLGIHTVINLTSSDSEANEKQMVEAAGMKYVQIPMTTHVPPTPDQIAQFLKITGDAQSEPVYVHCVGGKHRTGVMTAIYRMNSGWNADQAFDEMKKYKFGATFLHSEFKNFVYDFYGKLLSARSAPVQTLAPAAVVAH